MIVSHVLYVFFFNAEPKKLLMIWCLMLPRMVLIWWKNSYISTPTNESQLMKHWGIPLLPGMTWSIRARNSEGNHPYGNYDFPYVWLFWGQLYPSDPKIKFQALFYKLMRLSLCMSCEVIITPLLIEIQELRFLYPIVACTF